MSAVLGTLGAAAIQAIGGLLGNQTNKKMDSPRESILSQAQGAREAAAKFGFNPLTMLQYGQGGNMSSGTPPLASADLLTGALQSVSDVVSGETARRAAANQLELDLGRIKLDQLRAGGAAAVGAGAPPLGRRALRVNSVGAMNDPFNPFPGGAVNAPERITVSTLPHNPLLDPVQLTAGEGGGIAVPTPRLDRGAGTFWGGIHLESTPGWSPGQVIENEYGEVAAAVHGVAKMASDVGTTFGSWAAKSPNSPFQKSKYRNSNK